MRIDMDKVLVERPRYGAKLSKGAVKRQQQFGEYAEYAPKYERINLYHDKGLNENLQPLLRFLRSNTDKPWDQVYSEIRACISFDNTVQRHICQHLWQFVEKDVVYCDESKKDVRKTTTPDYYQYRRLWFYIDPDTKLLKKYPHVTRKAQRKIDDAKKAKDPVHRVIAGRHYHKIDDKWRLIEYGNLPTAVTLYFTNQAKKVTPAPHVYDVMLRRLVSHDNDADRRALEKQHGYQTIYARSQRCLKASEVRDLQLP